MDTTDLPDTQESRADYLRAHNAANFLKAVAKSRQKSAELLLSVRAFYREPNVLYVALDYAAAENVSVLVMPSSTSTDY